MRVRVSDIDAKGEAGLVLGLDPASDPALQQALDAAAEVEATFVGGSVHLLSEGEGQVQARVQGTVGFTKPCDRCGTPVELSLVVDEALTYVPSGDDSYEEEHELSEDELDVGWYDDGALLTEDLLSEAVVLALPTRHLCPDGLGAEGTACQPRDAMDPTQPQGHPAFANLADLV